MDAELISSLPHHRKAQVPSRTPRTSWSCGKCLCPGCSRCPMTATCSGQWLPLLPHTLTHCRKWRWRPTLVTVPLAMDSGKDGREIGPGREDRRMGNWAAWQGWREERWGPCKPQATQFRCIPAPGPVTSAHSPPPEPRASFQIPSAASSPARISDPLRALSPRATPRSLSLSRILCRQVRETFASQEPLGTPLGSFSPEGKHG